MYVSVCSCVFVYVCVWMRTHALECVCVCMHTRAYVFTSSSSHSIGQSNAAPRFTFRQHRAAVKALAWCPWQKNILGKCSVAQCIGVMCSVGKCSVV
jgi:hypothetical protein